MQVRAAGRESALDAADAEARRVLRRTVSHQRLRLAALPEPLTAPSRADGHRERTRSVALPDVAGEQRLGEFLRHDAVAPFRRHDIGGRGRAHVALPEDVYRHAVRDRVRTHGARDRHRVERIAVAERVVALRGRHTDVRDGRLQLRLRRVVPLHVADDLSRAAIGVGDQVDDSVAVHVATVLVDLDRVDREHLAIHANLVLDLREPARRAALDVRLHLPVAADVLVEAELQRPAVVLVVALLVIVVITRLAEPLALLLHHERVDALRDHRVAHVRGQIRVVDEDLRRPRARHVRDAALVEIVRLRAAGEQVRIDAHPVVHVEREPGEIRCRARRRRRTGRR